MNLILQPPFADRAMPPFCRQSWVGNPAEVGHEGDVQGHQSQQRSLFKDENSSQCEGFKSRKGKLTTRWCSLAGP